MRVAVVHNRRNPDGPAVLNVFGPQNRETYNPRTVELVARALEHGGHTVRVIDGNMDVIEALKDFMPRVMAGERPGMVFNMAYGIQGVSRYTHLPACSRCSACPTSAPGRWPTASPSTRSSPRSCSRTMACPRRASGTSHPLTTTSRIWSSPSSSNRRWRPSPTVSAWSTTGTTCARPWRRSSTSSSSTCWWNSSSPGANSPSGSSATAIPRCCRSPKSTYAATPTPSRRPRRNCVIPSTSFARRR